MAILERCQNRNSTPFAPPTACEFGPGHFGFSRNVISPALEGQPIFGIFRKLGRSKFRLKFQIELFGYTQARTPKSLVTHPTWPSTSLRMTLANILSTAFVDFLATSYRTMQLGMIPFLRNLLAHNPIRTRRTKIPLESIDDMSQIGS